MENPSNHFVLGTKFLITSFRNGSRILESSTKNMLRIVVLVYLIPVVLFLAGYVIMSLLTDSVAAQYAVAAAGFAAGIVFAIFYDRRLRARGGLTFNIVRVF